MRNKIFFFLLVLILSTFMGPGKNLSQPLSREDPMIKLGEVTFKVREIESTPSAIKVLEFYVEVLNKSRRTTAPPNSIKVVVSQKEVVYAGPKPAEEFAPAPQETVLSIPLPPLTGRVLIFGVPLPREKVESITFDIHLTPPEGEKKNLSIIF
jgi:hypothetical protein